ncbi:MAG: DoxX family protein [Bacteroidota bacterium]
MKNKILFVISLLYGLNFINGGLNKFLNYMPVPEDMPEKAMKMFSAMMEIDWLMPLLGAFEIIGGVLVIIPRFRALGALVLTPIVVGILMHHISMGAGLPFALIFMAILIWIIIDNKNKYMPLIGK